MTGRRTKSSDTGGWCRCLFNSVMVAVIAMIVAAAVLGVGYIRGWFGDGGRDSATLADARGIVNVTRSGVTYPVEQDTPLRKGDVITCTPGAAATVRIADGSALAIGEQADLTVEDPSARSFSARIGFGELFGENLLHLILIGRDAAGTVEVDCFK